MSYESILVPLQLGMKNARLLGVVGDLAARCGAHVCGIAMCHPIHFSPSDANLISDSAVRDREVRMQEIVEAEDEFRQMMAGRATSIDWHAGMTAVPIAREVADQARDADILVTAAERNCLLFKTPNDLRIGDLLMQIGRPILVVPDSAERLSLDHVLLGWKDGREAQRAVADALPLLKKAGRVTVVEIVPESELPEARHRLDQVVTWLARHRIEAKALPTSCTNDDAARFKLLASDLNATFVVAGAYAHSRFHELVFGGVTRELLLHTGLCSMLSH
jgi:nucleotide-binding universal stress UspA family protein